MKNKFHINRMGYMLGMAKSAVCTVYGKVFSLVDVRTGAYVYEGRLSDPFTDGESGDTVRIADFSDYDVQGRYYIKIGFRRSESFDISPFPYRILRDKVLDAIYMSRCGCKVSAENSELSVFAHEECHASPAEYEGKTYDIHGGWHTMGGYEKNVPHTCLVIADMLYSLLMFKPAFDDHQRARMEDECRWGLDFLLRMQDSDGGVFQSLYPTNTYTDGMPETDTDTFRLADKSALATLRFSSVTALAARYFSADLPYSRKLASASQIAWVYIVESSEYEHYKSKFGDTSNEPDGIYTLGSEFMWTMCELYALTGGSRFESMIEKKYTGCLFSGFGDRFTGGYAALAYMLTDKPKKEFILSFIRMRWSYRADRLWLARCSSGYHTTTSAGGGFHYGSNSRILSNARQSMLAFLITGEKKYLTCATDSIGYIFGCNPIGTAFMTDNRNGFCRNPCHRLSSAAEADMCVPGLVVCGANALPFDPFSKWNIDKGTPPAKCYVDNKYAFSTNEPSIHFSSPLLFISAFYDCLDKSAFNTLTGV